MAAGIIYKSVTTKTGEEVSMPFYVDDTVTPTTFKPAHVLITAAGALVEFQSAGLKTNATGLGVSLTTDHADVPVAAKAGEAHIGEVGGKTILKQVVLSSTASAHSAGNVIAETQQIDAALRKTDGTGLLTSIEILCKDDQGPSLDIYILTANVSFGTEAGAIGISDTNGEQVIGPFSVLAADYKDLGGCKKARIANINQAIAAVASTDDLYIAVVTQTAYTPTTAGLVLRLGISQD